MQFCLHSLTITGRVLNDECFRTVLTEVESIVNRRPLSGESLNDSDSLVPLTSNLLLTAKSKIFMTPRWNFNNNEIYIRRRYGEECNIWWTNFDADPSNQGTSDNERRETSRLVVGDFVILKDDGLQKKRVASCSCNECTPTGRR